MNMERKPLARRADGRFAAQCRVPKNLQHLTTSKVLNAYGETESEARAALDRLLSNLRSQAKSNSVAHVAEALWWPTIKGHSPHTQNAYKSVYDRFVCDSLGQLDIRTVTRAQLAQCLTRASAPGIRHHLKNVLRGIWQRAFHAGIIDTNPAMSLVSAPKAPFRERVISIEARAELLRTLQGRPIFLPVYLACVFGMRAGEIAGLKTSCIDCEIGWIDITAQRSIVPGLGTVTKKPKCGSDRLLSGIPPEAFEPIRSLIPEGETYVCQLNGRPWTVPALSKAWRQVRDEVGLPDWHFHDLRHAATACLYASGAGLMEIAKVLGHKRPDMTLTYLHVERQQVERALSTLKSAVPITIAAETSVND